MYAPQHSTGAALMEKKRNDTPRIGRSGPTNTRRSRHRRPRLRITRVFTALLLVGCLMAVGCSTERSFGRVYGSGRTATESRPVAGFDHISVAGGGEVIVEVTGRESLVVEAEDNLLEVLTVEVVDGDLRLGVAPYLNIEPTRPIVYRITAARLDGVSVSGSATIEAAVVDADRFDVSISGSGRVMPHGAVTDLDVRIGGSGRFEGEALAAEYGTVTVSGSGRAMVNVTRDLDASVSGSGRVGYLGDPVVHSASAGSGSIGKG